MNESALDKKRIITELTKSAHGKLEEYISIGAQAAIEDPDFFAHLVAWNHVKGQVRDAKIALPVIALASLKADAKRLGLEGLGLVYAENALAHLADLSPQLLKRVLLETTRIEKTDLVVTPKLGKPKTVKGMKALTVPPFIDTAKAPIRLMRRFVTRYLRDLEADRRHFEYTAVQHSNTLHELYAHYHISRPAWVGEILFHGEKGRLNRDAVKSPSNAPIFDAIRRLHLMGPEEAAGTIVRYKIPFLIARGALGKKAAEPDTVLALIKAMSPTELVTNMKWLEKLGVKTNPALRAALELALGKAITSKAPKATFKTTRAAEALRDDEVLSGKLHAMQEKQLDKLGGIEGDWLVLGDKSGSMSSSIEVAREVAGTLARMVKGNVYLVFFDSMPRSFEVTGKTLEEIKQITAGITAGGGTIMNSGIQLAIDRKLKVDGIVFISDGANHGGPVTPVYQRYCEQLGIEPPLYFYQLPGEADSFSGECKRAGVELQTFDLRKQQIDYYSLPTLTQTMRVARYAMLDEIVATPLRTLDEVLDKTIGMRVLPQAERVTT